jgi:hypothetical protein
MRFKLLLFSMMVLAGLFGQAQNRSLIFSEVRIDNAHQAFLEITNMGTKDIDLSEYQVGSIGAWGTAWGASANGVVRLPKVTLKPGESYLIACMQDLAQERSVINYQRWGDPITNKYMWGIVDLEVHIGENGPANQDSISTFAGLLGDDWSGRTAHFLRHYHNGDSTIVDAVNTDFTNNGQRPEPKGPATVAGKADATGNSILVRKYSIKQGVEGWDTVSKANENWVKQQGSDIADSEWLPIPIPDGTDPAQEYNRKLYWTIGSHTNTKIDANTIKSDLITFDFNNLTMNVPWGIRSKDSIMNAIKRVDGVAWYYVKSGVSADSAYSSVRTGDKFTLYGLGETLDQKQFTLTALAPLASENRVIPKHSFNANFTGYTRNIPYRVTEKVSPIDSVTHIPFATRVDTLFKYLEKPTNATWEIVFVDGVVRPDLKKGDKLKVKAENGATKEYYLKVDKINPNHNAYLSAITWPDIPEMYFNNKSYGWDKDTILGFSNTTFSYPVVIPMDVDGIPQLVATAENLDTRIQVKRAKSLAGSLLDRTVTFSTTAEDDTTFRSYNVIFSKEKDPDNIQPWAGEPFISQFTFRAGWGSSYWEFVNPGNQIMDMSNYMFVRGWSANPAELLTAYSGTDQWNNRFTKYVPGYIWVDQASWEVQPVVLKKDEIIRSQLMPGDVFVIASTSGNSNKPRHLAQVDVRFQANPWGETISGENAAFGWLNDEYGLFKILNDSIQRGLKSATNINDFEILDIWAMAEGNDWVVAGTKVDQVWGFTRKPNVYHGNPVAGSSFGTTEADSEWTWLNRARLNLLGWGWDEDVYAMSDGMGSHTMNEVTHYKSTVGSSNYIVSDGYTETETIIGVKTGTTVDQFLANINKADANQKLTVMHNGTAISGATAVSNNDVLVVVSADTEINNVSKYTIAVTTEGLEKNALITSVPYKVTVSGAKGTITGFDYGTPLQTIFDGLVIPETASNYAIYDSKGAYVAFQTLNYDTIYAPTLINDAIFIEVVAQDGVTKIEYQFTPTAKAFDAFVTSARYAVNQEASVITLVPVGTNTPTFLSFLTPVTGATIKLVDKAGLERTSGNIYQDDRLIVTSKDGSKTKIYFINMLSNLTTSYLAYAYSNVYIVDQVTLKVSQGINNQTTVADFKTKVFGSFGATLSVLDKDGNVKASGNMAKDDKLKVTSSDGKYSSTYAVEVGTVGVDRIANGDVRMYPNPTTGFVTMEGVKAGSVVKLVNTLGSVVMNMVTTADNETINIENQKSGIYMVVVSSNNKVVGNFKLIKQ